MKKLPLSYDMEVNGLLLIPHNDDPEEFFGEALVRPSGVEQKNKRDRLLVELKSFQV